MLLDTQLQMVIMIEMGETVTNVAAAANVNGETASEVESLSVVSAVTENDLWDTTMDANVKIVVRMTATTESVSNLFISIPLSSSTLLFLCSSFSSSLYRSSLPPWSTEVIGL